jgi:cobalamin-independent methionine synthase catalytic subunit
MSRILTTHVGSLPRPEDLVRTMFAKQEGVPVDPVALERRTREAVKAVVAKQIECGVDIVSDGEMGKPSSVTYITDRLDGFGGTSQTLTYQDLVEFPNLQKEGLRRPGAQPQKDTRLRRADHGQGTRARRATTSTTSPPPPTEPRRAQPRHPQHRPGGAAHACLLGQLRGSASLRRALQGHRRPRARG